VRQHNSDAVEDFILLFSAVYLRIPCPQVKELLKSLHICQSYRKNKTGTFFMAQSLEIQNSKDQFLADRTATQYDRLLA